MLFPLNEHKGHRYSTQFLHVFVSHLADDSKNTASRVHKKVWRLPRRFGESFCGR